MTDDTTEKRLEAIATRWGLTYTTTAALFAAGSVPIDAFDEWLGRLQGPALALGYTFETLCRHVLDAVRPRPAPIDYSELELQVAALFKLQAKAADVAALSLRAHALGRRDSTPWQVKKAGKRWKR